MMAAGQIGAGGGKHSDEAGGCAIAFAVTLALSWREGDAAACGEASSTSSETSSEKPARSHDWFDVFSSSRRTK